MSEVPDYVIDTSFLTQPNRDYYAFDICPSFWESLSRLVIERKVETIDKVRKEIMNGSYDDELKKWIRPQPSFFVISTDEQDVIDEYGRLNRRVQADKNFTNPAKAEFADIKNADGWVVSYAKVRRKKVLSQEVYSAGAKNKVPIPNLCKELGIPHLNITQFLREMKIQI